MLSYGLVSSLTAIHYLKKNQYDNYWYENTASDEFWIRPVDCYGIYNGSALKGIIILEKWPQFYEPHIFTHPDIRGKELKTLLLFFLDKIMAHYKLLIGRIPRGSNLPAAKATRLFARWLGMRSFRKDNFFEYMGRSITHV